ncbi:MAG: hypothetical protein ACLUNO_05370 [Oscillospiraceae bacterium]
MQRYCDAIEEIAARFLISTGSDKIGRKGAMLLCFAITILAIVLPTFSKGIVYVVCFWLLSFTYGGTAATMPSLTTDYLGSENAGLVLAHHVNDRPSALPQSEQAFSPRPSTPPWPSSWPA